MLITNPRATSSFHLISLWLSVSLLSAISAIIKVEDRLDSQLVDNTAGSVERVYGTLLRTNVRNLPCLTL